MAKFTLNHRERIERTLAGDLPDRVPVALWRHFPVDDQTPEDLAEAAVTFQKTYDFDLVKVTPSSSFCLLDWGITDRWNGATEGTRDYVGRIIHGPDDWHKLPPLDPHKGSLGAQIRCLELICRSLGENDPVIQTIFSPLSQAKNLIGGDDLLVHLRRYPDAVHQGLKTITETTVDFIQAIKPTGIAGVFFAVQHAQYGLLSEPEFAEFGKKYDLQVLDAVNDLWLNMVHLHGREVMFDIVAGYPVQIINWHDRNTPPSLSEAQEKYQGVLCGGLERFDTMVLGTPEKVQREARQAIEQTGGRKFILGTGCVLPITVPHGNIRTARKAVETVIPG